VSSPCPCEVCVELRADDAEKVWAALERASAGPVAAADEVLLVRWVMAGDDLA
jgi:hypothetical protein